MSKLPFQGGTTDRLFDGLLKDTFAAIDALDSEYVLKASATELETFFVNKVTVHPISLDVNEQSIEDKRTIHVDVSHDFSRAILPGENAHVPGTQLRIAIPYEGEEYLWDIRPSQYSLGGYPEIDVFSDKVILTFSFPDDSPDQTKLKCDIERAVTALSDTVNNQMTDVELHNRTAPDRIKARLADKRQKSTNAVDVVASLGIPMQRRQEPATYVAPVTRRPKISSSKPAVSTEKFRPEPVLDGQEYEHILKVLRSMSLVIERNPASFATLDEEGIRDHFLLQLNGHYEGAATGETFNAVGKTDILIRVEDRNAFIAECKFWRGPKGFDETVDQLLGYLTWRDCKCALLIFNRNRDSTAVLRKMQERMESRPEWRKTLSHDTNSESRYVLVKESDPGREIIVTTLLFDIPTKLEHGCSP